MYSYLNGKITISKDEILSRVYSRPEDVVILSGTLVEGIGNAHSDFDVYVITNELPEKSEERKHNFAVYENNRLRQYYDYMNSGGFGFDAEYYFFGELHSMVDKLESSYKAALLSTKILRAELSNSVDDALHKLFIGVVLQGEEKLSSILTPELHKKMAFIRYRNKTAGYPEFKDIMGAWISEDIDTALHNMRSYLLDQISGLTHLCGNTNGKPKWIPQSIKRLPQQFESCGLTVMTWLGRESQTVEQKKSKILDACDIIDDIYSHSRTLLDTGDIGYNVQDALRLTQEEFERESFHDEQTKIEFEHRRMMFCSSRRSLRDFLINAS